VSMPFLKPFMPQTHTVPGFRLGPNLPRARRLAFTRYCYSQYCIVCIAIKGSGGNQILRTSVGDKGGGWAPQRKGVFAQSMIDVCTKGSNGRSAFKPLAVLGSQ